MARKKGWLRREIEGAEREIRRWPAWVRHAAAFEPYADEEATQRTTPSGEEKE